MKVLIFILTLFFVPKIFSDGNISADRERFSDSPTGWWYFTNTTEAALNTFTTEKNYRIIDIEKRPGTNDRYTASLVKNAGHYKVNGWWWYHGTAAFIASKVAEHNARIIDLETYEEGRERKYIAVMISNTGSIAKAWWYYIGQTAQQISEHLTEHGARLVTLKSYSANQGIKYLAVMIKNEGEDQRMWWWYINKNFDFINAKLTENDARPFDLERRANGNFDIIMVKNDGTGNWWHTSKDEEGLEELVNQTHSRIIDIEPFTLAGKVRFAFISLDNANLLEKKIRNFYDPLAPEARRGFYLKQIGGNVLADVRGSDNFIPASSTKVLYLYTALDMVRQNQLNLLTMDKSLCGADTTASPGNSPTIATSCPYSNQRCPNALTPMNLQTLLSRMMVQSNNRATQSIREIVTQNRINQTANGLGMSATSITERIGCGVNVCLDNQNNEVMCDNNNNVVDFGYRGTPLNGNKVTLEDFAKIYENVFDNKLGAQTGNFFQIMLSNISSNNNWVNTVADQENISVGLSASELAEFKSKLKYAWKGGSYSNQNFVHFAQNGSLSVPYDMPSGDVYKNYAFGVFQDKGPNGQNDVTISVVQELIRDVIRAGMKTYNHIERAPILGDN